MESRFSGESRCTSFGGNIFSGYSSESRSSESRSIPVFVSSSSESRDASESRCMISRVTSSRKSSTTLSKKEIENSLESIDELIDKLDVTITSSSARVKKVASVRSKKIAELRELREELLTRAQEDKEIEKIEAGNEELDSLIKSLRNKLR